LSRLRGTSYAESAALPVDEVLPHEPMRQWVLSVPFPLRFLFASEPKIMGKALGIVYRKKILVHLQEKLPARAALLLPDSRAPLQSSLFG